MASWTAKINYSFEEEHFNIDKLKAELNRVGLSFDSVSSLDNGEFECFTNEFTNALEGVTCSASISFTKGCMYTRNGDPGYPDESEFEDLEVDDISILGKKISILKCLTSNTLNDLEVKLCEQEQEYD